MSGLGRDIRLGCATALVGNRQLGARDRGSHRCRCRNYGTRARTPVHAGWAMPPATRNPRDIGARIWSVRGAPLLEDLDA